MNIKDKVVKQVQHKTVLGIKVDVNLDFNQHIQMRENKGFKSIKGTEYKTNKIE